MRKPHARQPLYLFFKKCMVRRVASSRILERLGVVCKNVSGLLVERAPGHDEDSRAPVLIRDSATKGPFFNKGLGHAVRLFRHLVVSGLADRGDVSVTTGEYLAVFPPEPPVAVFNLLERSAAGKGARQRGEANPCRRAPFWHFHHSGRAAEREHSDSRW